MVIATGWRGIRQRSALSRTLSFSHQPRLRRKATFIARWSRRRDGTCGPMAYPGCAIASRIAVRAAGVRRNMDRHTAQAGGTSEASQSLADHRQSAAADLCTTLVLQGASPDFSTDAGNSALIVNNEVSATSCNPSRPARRRMTKAKKNEASAHFTIWLTRERTPCHGRSFLVGNSSLLPPCHRRH